MSGPLRYLALGDSYTAGEGVAESDRWPQQLVDLLREREFDIADPEVIARTGWTTDELLAGINAAAPSGPYDLVTLQVGVNDQYRGMGVVAFAQGFARVLDRAIDLAGGDGWHVVVMSIPDWGVSPFAEGRDRDAIAEEIDLFNTVAFASVMARGYPHFVAVTAHSREAAGQPESFVADGLHPSAAVHRDWAELALHSADHLLKHPTPPMPTPEEIEDLDGEFRPPPLFPE